ncbi:MULTISPECIES: hypothetical protein [unclassified Chryseobacterium]|uniref:hypothetical protein n=1 Tax=unclassified Chryseobacterium TaxID=2593645 RepID=UPI0030187824
MQYQIEQNWGKDCKVWDYFESEGNEDEVKKQAVKIVKAAHEKKLERKRHDPFTNIDPSRPTIIIRENPARKDGIVYKTKWR